MAYTTIDDPSAYFQTLLYAGGSSSYTNSGNSDLQPDWVWIKARNNAYEHKLWDSNRGTTKLLVTSTAAQATQSGLTAFNSDGFSLGGDGGSNDANTNFVAWQWAANKGNLTTAAESGSNVGYSRQVNTTSGFAIIKYTGIGSGAAVIHGMGATPAFFTVKRLTGSGYSWYTYHHKNTSAPHTDNLYLNNDDSTADMDTVWNDQAPSSTEIKLGTNTGVNADGVEYIMYAFAEKQGYSKFGSYTGNGNADGPFIYTGFKPAWVIVKEAAANSNDWNIYDSKRSVLNSMDDILEANLTDAEGTGRANIDFLSNGFKQRNTHADSNRNSGGFIYLAFAESPFVSSEGVPTTAR